MVKLWEHYELSGNNRSALLELLRQKGKNGQPLFYSVSSPKPFTALALGARGVSPRRASWTRAAQALRDLSPYIAMNLSAESLAAAGGELEIRQKTSAKESQYYDTPDFGLFRADNDASLRWVVKFDGQRAVSATMNSLSDSVVDSLGFERHGSNGLTAAHRPTDFARLDRAIRSGRAMHEGKLVEHVATAQAYRIMFPKANAASPAVSFEAKAHLRSHSAAYALDRTSPRELAKIERMSRSRLETLIRRIEEAAAASSGTSSRELRALQKQTRELLAIPRPTLRFRKVADVEKARQATDRRAAALEKLVARAERSARAIAGSDPRAIIVLARQARSGANAMRARWFNAAEKFYVPGGGHYGASFLEPKVALTEVIDPRVWNRLPASEKNPFTPVDPRNVTHVYLTGEAELAPDGESAYLERIASLERRIATDRASMVMKYLAARGRRATGAKALDQLVSLPAHARARELRALNAFVQKSGSGLSQITAGDLRELDPSLFTSRVMRRSIRTDSELEGKLEGARFVFGEYRAVQRKLAAAQGRHLSAGLRQLGAEPGTRWVKAKRSKRELVYEDLMTQGR